MLNFFRKIRRTLSDNNQFLKYSKYAIGEILLVVIGILIALQVNNWNENRKQNIQELKYLNRISEDLANDTYYYSERISQAMQAVDSLNKFIKLSYETQKNHEEVKKLFSLLLINTDHLTTSNSTYREMLSTGGIDIISNENLKMAIVDYYRFNEKKAIEIEEFNLVSTEYLVEASRVVKNLHKFFNDSEGPFNDPKMFSKGEWYFINVPTSDEHLALQSMAYMYQFRNREQLGVFHELLDYAEKVLVQTQEELKKNK